MNVVQRFWMAAQAGVAVARERFRLPADAVDGRSTPIPMEVGQPPVDPDGPIFGGDANPPVPVVPVVPVAPVSGAAR